MAEIALMSDSNEVKIWQYWIDFFSTCTELTVRNPCLCQFGHLIRICDIKGSNSLFWIVLVIFKIEKYFKIPSFQSHLKVIYRSLFLLLFFAFKINKIIIKSTPKNPGDPRGKKFHSPKLRGTKKNPFLMFLILRGIKLGEELQTLLRYDLYFILLIAIY